MYGHFSMLGLSVLAQSGDALISWTPETFYLAAALAHTAIIWVGYRLLGADAEHNTITGAFAAAALGNIVAFIGRDYAIVGFTATSIAFYLLLLVTSGIDIFRSLVVFILVIGSYALLGNYITDNTPLDAYDIAGVPKVLMTGGFQPEPLEQKDGDVVPHLDSEGTPERRDYDDD